MQKYGHPKKNHKGKPQRELLKYNCNYCGYVFKHWVGKLRGDGRHSISTQVQCPMCTNFLKTW